MKGTGTPFSSHLDGTPHPRLCRTWAAHTESNTSWCRKSISTRTPPDDASVSGNNKWCFYNLSEAYSWVDGERQYLRTTGLQEVVKFLLPIHIYFDNALLSLSVSLFFLFFFLLLLQSVCLFFFFFPFPSSPFHFDLSNCKSCFELTGGH